MIQRTQPLTSRREEDYLDWLGSKVVDDRKHSIRLFIRTLYSYRFFSIVANDENRELDGLMLRRRYGEEIRDKNFEADFRNRPCNLLEMLVALAGRINFLMLPPQGDEDRTAEWFWMLIENLGLEFIFVHDSDIDRKLKHNDRIIRIFLNREYDIHGHGGLFPLEKSRKDQRYVEIWYQMQEYISKVLL